MSRITLLLALLLAGCHAHTGVGVATGTPGMVPEASASVHVHAGPAIGALIGIGIIAASIRDEHAYPGRVVPQLDPSRRIAEQDCSRPIEDWSANLRCR